MVGIKQQKLSDIITEKLESMILDGSFVAGERLPAERVLAEEFNVSRPSLREAFKTYKPKVWLSANRVEVRLSALN